MRRSSLPVGGSHKASRATGGLKGAEGGSLGAGSDAGAAQYVDCLLQAGFLVRHQMGAVEVMRLTAPGAGSVVRD